MHPSYTSRAERRGALGTACLFFEVVKKLGWEMLFLREDFDSRPAEVT
jgi:hypothetical protein